MILELKNIKKIYEDINVLHNLSFHVDKNEILCILGPSGCGKTTILNLITELIKPDEGYIFKKNEKTGYVFQEDRLLPWKTLYENIKLVSNSKSKDEIYEMIKLMELDGFENKYPDQLSGGMRQRASIVRAFCYDADLLLMDEPFKSLDYTLRISMIKHLINIWEKVQNSIVFVTHEIDEALLLGDRILILSNRPTSVLKEFKIDIKQIERKLDNPILNEYRNKIINFLVK